MAVLNLMFEFADESRLDETALTIQERLSGIDVVNEVEAIPEESSRSTGLEIAAAIGVTVLIVRGGRELVEEIRKLVTEVKKLMVEFQDLKYVYINLGNQRISLDELSEEQYQQLAEEEV